MSVYGRMNSLAAEMDRLMRMEGHRTGLYVLHTPSAQCSCMQDDGQPVPTCRVCGGSGYYHPPALTKKRLAIVSQASTDRQILSGPGIIEREDILVTFADRIFPAARDLIRFDRPDLFHLTTPAEGFPLTRGVGPTDALPQRVARLLQVVRSDDRGGTVVNYRPNIDVTFSGNILTWQAATQSPPQGVVAPPTGAEYAVTYHGDYDWLVLENLAPRAVGQVAMGARALCRRRFTDQREFDRQGPVGPNGYVPLNLY